MKAKRRFYLPLVFSCLLSFFTATLINTTLKAQDAIGESITQTIEHSNEAAAQAPVHAQLVINQAGDIINTLPVVTNDQLFQFLIDSLGGLKGAGTLGIAYIISQLLLFFLLSPLFQTIFPKLEKDGWKLLIAVGVHLVVGVLGLMIKDSLSFSLAITHSTTLAAFAVLFNQVYKKFFASKAKV